MKGRIQNIESVSHTHTAHGSCDCIEVFSIDSSGLYTHKYSSRSTPLKNTQLFTLYATDYTQLHQLSTIDSRATPLKIQQDAGNTCKQHLPIPCSNTLS